MMHSFISDLRTFWREQRGNSLVAYALLLGGIAVAIAAAMGDFSMDLSDALTHQASSLEQTAQGNSPTSTATSPTTPTSPTTTSGGSSGSSGGRRGRRR
jgi:Flp pilus assembly pilin Flp